ncbi:hypothetical protein VTI74DRAFT_6875 [Chaetomium olivicolor]
MLPHRSILLHHGNRDRDPSDPLAARRGDMYSDEDIELVHAIVGLAESIYPTLPERERLHTNALFLAAEELLPQHGYDPENAPSHISRLIFKIGGHRSGETLGDKFRSVLEGIGIKLEFVPGSANSSPRPASRASSAPSTTNTRTSGFDLGLAGTRVPRRRHSDVSGRSERLDVSDEVSQPLHYRAGHRRRSHSLGLAGGDSTASSAKGFDRDGTGREASWFLQRDHGFHHSLAQPILSRPSAVVPVDLAQHRSALDFTHGGHRAAPDNDAASCPPGQQTDLHRGLALPVCPQPSPTVAVDMAELESKLAHLRRQEEQMFLSGVCAAWQAAASHAKQHNDQLRAFAAEYDHNDLLGEVLDIWYEEAAAAEEQRLKAEAATKYEAYVVKMERRATRTYEIFTTRTLLEKWQALAQEELERTEAARRHLLRKRTFEGWHAQHIKDETKVQNFILNNALQTWIQVALHHEVRNEVAAHWHEQQLCKDVLQTMYEECLGHLADDCYHTSLARGCLNTWADKARNLSEEYRVAAALDERLLLDEVVNIWLEETEQQQYDAYECTRQFLIQGCRKDLDHWQEQARLWALLRQFTTKDEADTMRSALETWHGLSHDAGCNAQLADAFMAKEPVDHWERMMKLKLFLEREEYETKASILEQWALEEKLAWYQRHLETRDKRQTLDTLLSAARQARAEHERREQEAGYVDDYHTQADVIDVWLAEIDKMSIQHQNADLVNLYRTTRPCIDHWRERCHQHQARDSYYTKRADRHRARTLVSGVLDEWPEIAERVRRERMMSNLRQFRRRYKVELAQECLGKWLQATADAVDTGRDAHDINLHYKREDVSDCLDFWNYSAKIAANLHRIAADAELEVYYGKWQTQLQENQENMVDAIEFDEEQTRKRCWEKWEFQTLQQGSKRHLADTINEKNERRVRRKILEDWQEKAVPGATINPRRSTLSSRRSIRLARSSRQGFYTASQLATLPPLGPMPEFDEEPDAVSTPTRWTGNPLAAATTTPSAILPTPFEQRLRQVYGGARVAFAGIDEESGEDLYR